MTAVRIAAQFRGPPHSGNGGYACGTAADGLPQPAEVTLHAPPPLDTDLTLHREPGGNRLTAGDLLVASARSVEVDLPVREAVSYDEALRARDAFDIVGYERMHAYPGCFTCGPQRRDGDGLRIFPAPTGDTGVTAWPWTAPESFADPDGALPMRVVWAALDCPSGLAWIVSDREMGPVVLGRMTVRVTAAVPVGQPLVVSGWTESADGRKRVAGSAIWSREGELLASSRATWLVLTEEQRKAFGAAGGPAT